MTPVYFTYLDIVEDMWERGWCVAWIHKTPAGTRQVDICIGEPLNIQSIVTEKRYIASLKGAQDVAIACRAVSGAFIWKYKKEAARALRLARAELRVLEDGRPLPEWARKALAEGWKPPRRWRPS